MDPQHFDAAANDQAPAGIRFEKTISVGNVMTLVAMLAPMLMWGLQLHADVQGIKAALPKMESRQREADGKQDVIAAETKREIKDELKEINRKLDRIIENRGGKLNATER